MIDKNTFLPGKVANRARLLMDFLTKKEKTGGLPLEIGIEVINQCNLRCIMCSYSEMVSEKIRPIGKMSFFLFKKIIDEIAPFAELVYLHGLGESLLHSQIFEFIEYTKKKGIRTGISTNATLLDKEKSRMLLKTGIDYVIFAIDGATKKTYERIRVGSNLEKVEKNVKQFLRLKDLLKTKVIRRVGKGPFTVIQYVTMKENEHEVDLFLKKWKGKGADVIRIKPKIALRDNDKKRQKKATPYCFHIFRMLNLLWDGTVVACCEDFHGHYGLGNVKKTSLKKLWNSKKMRDLRRINFEGQRKKINICRQCFQPQPTILQATGSLILDHLTLKKILPRVENFVREKIDLPY